ncbi:MAG: hypothetical protein WCI09_05715 [Planctomycetota bacterium]
MPPKFMASKSDLGSIPDHLVSIEKRTDGTVVVRMHSDGPNEKRLPDAVFAFRCGDPQYAYWLNRLTATLTAEHPVK